ncbi:MAG: site-specific DNA-methyltransferase [Gammaproteobacteria bacterium]|nr:site-specific DNA-methyltransferase [Gammaproteobacteria bacterium]
MRGINTGCIDLIYLDPPFNKNKKFTAPIGTSAEGASFKDIFRERDLKAEWVQTISEDHPELHHFLTGIKGVGKPYNFAYLAYMAIRLIECHRILKDTGSIYLHCDPTMSHYLKTTMDCIFGEDNFRSEVIWSNEDVSGFKSRAANWIRGHDTILYYLRDGHSDFQFNKEYLPFDQKTIKRYDKIDAEGRRYKIYKNKDGTERYSFLKKEKGPSVSNVWTDCPSFQKVNNTGEYIGYPTQKPIALLERIIAASSDGGGGSA